MFTIAMLATLTVQPSTAAQAARPAPLSRYTAKCRKWVKDIFKKECFETFRRRGLLRCNLHALIDEITAQSTTVLQTRLLGKLDEEKIKNNNFSYRIGIDTVLQFVGDALSESTTGNKDMMTAVQSFVEKDLYKRFYKVKIQDDLRREKLVEELKTRTSVIHTSIQMIQKSPKSRRCNCLQLYFALGLASVSPISKDYRAWENESINFLLQGIMRVLYRKIEVSAYSEDYGVSLKEIFAIIKQLATIKRGMGCLMTKNSNMDEDRVIVYVMKDEMTNFLDALKAFFIEYGRESEPESPAPSAACDWFSMDAFQEIQTKIQTRQWKIEEEAAWQRAVQRAEGVDEDVDEDVEDSTNSLLSTDTMNELWDVFGRRRRLGQVQAEYTPGLRAARKAFEHRIRLRRRR